MTSFTASSHNELSFTRDAAHQNSETSPDKIALELIYCVSVPRSQASLARAGVPLPAQSPKMYCCDLDIRWGEIPLFSRREVLSLSLEETPDVLSPPGLHAAAATTSGDMGSVGSLSRRNSDVPCASGLHATTLTSSSVILASFLVDRAETSS